MKTSSPHLHSQRSPASCLFSLHSQHQECRHAQDPPIHTETKLLSLEHKYSLLGCALWGPVHGTYHRIYLQDTYHRSTILYQNTWGQMWFAILSLSNFRKEQGVYTIYQMTPPPVWFRGSILQSHPLRFLLSNVWVFSLIGIGIYSIVLHSFRSGCFAKSVHIKPTKKQSLVFRAFSISSLEIQDCGTVFIFCHTPPSECTRDKNRFVHWFSPVPRTMPGT